MAIRIPMINRKTGITKDGFIGFSWTYLFFGFLVPLIRGHYPMAGIHFLISLTNYFTLGIVGLVLAFFFNKFYTLRLVEEGYDFAEPESDLAKTARSVLGIVRPN